MKILATSDLHLQLAKPENLTALIDGILYSDADALVIAGDISPEERKLRRFLGLFQNLDMPKLVVAGNHDIWTPHGDSFDQYEKLHDIFSENGFHYLDSEPFVLDDIGFIGNIGWYDYSFRRIDGFWKDVPESDYQRKHAVIDREEVVWNDGSYVNWNFSDKAFFETCVRKLRKQLSEVRNKCKKIVAVTHHIPFENLVPRSDDNGFSYGNAFMGGHAMGDLLLEEEKVVLSISGHSHVPKHKQNGRIDCYNISNPYGTPKLTEIKLD